MAHDKVGFEEKRFFEGTAYHLLANKEINPIPIICRWKVCSVIRNLYD